jgi:hypothetical protein
MYAIGLSPRPNRERVVTIFIGILLGLLTAIVGWLITQSLVSPRIGWSEGISKVKTASAPSGYQYRIKLENIAWLRPVLDLRAEAVVVAKGLDPSRSTTWARIRLPLSFADVPRLLPGQTRVASIEVDSITANMRTRLRAYGYKDLADNDGRTLEDLLELPSAHLIITLLGDDGWTGATHYRESPRYRLSDIRSAYFRPDKTGLAKVMGRARGRLRPRWRSVRGKWHTRVLRRHTDLQLQDEAKT